MECSASLSCHRRHYDRAGQRGPRSSHQSPGLVRREHELGRNRDNRQQGCSDDGRSEMKRLAIMLSLAAVPLWGQSLTSNTPESTAKPSPTQSQLTPEQKKSLAGYDFTGAIRKLATPAAGASSPAP